jgi:hypothetical protein
MREGFGCRRLLLGDRIGRLRWCIHSWLGNVRLCFDPVPGWPRLVFRWRRERFRWQLERFRWRRERLTRNLVDCTIFRRRRDLRLGGR